MPETPRYADLSDDELLAQCRVETFRAGGPGGQHQNKTESGVRLTHGPTGVIATARDARSQLRNRAAALARLRRRLAARERRPKPRVPTRKTKAADTRRLEDKRRRGARKKDRRRPDVDD
ncbi:MAG: peptide chain release factor-like protein [Gemmatimonadetes bacterium]|nr:peptide chain release factor-like protein [Gemmatimonadota bacterium]